MKFLFAALSFAVSALSLAAADFRPPAVPLVAHDPYFSIWSQGDHLTDTPTTHWTGKPHPLSSVIRIDGTAHRLMGAEPAALPALPQTGVEVLPTRTLYRFANDAVTVTFTFLTPALPASLDVLARPLTYLVWDVAARDGREHEITLTFEASPLLAVDTPEQPVTGQRVTGLGWQALRCGTVEQPVLLKQGDDLRIDWGHAYVAADDTAWTLGFAAAGAGGAAALASFGPAPAGSAPLLRATRTLGRVGAASVSARLMLAYDDEFSIRYFDAPLRPYWRRTGLDAGGLIAAAGRDYPRLARECANFDRELMADLTRVGGPQFAQVGALAYRQTLAGSKLAADAKGAPLFFPKENRSNGCIATVDVIYPMIPFCYAFSPELARALLIPILDYAASPRWKFDYAPHDLGRYPHATGQVYGGGERNDERQMPVEESANLILLVAGLARVDGRLDLANRTWPQLEKWARYLEQKGFDPENQLCTDDFAGHLAHNVNLSAKAIVALGAYAQLCERRGLKAEGARVHALAAEFAARWQTAALDGDHYRLAFDLPGTWSQKYNLVWDRVLDLKLFPAAVLRREMDFYRQHQASYGLPLDSRNTYTKLDWIFWTASLTGDRADQDALIAPVHRFLHESPSRVPMTDWYFTDTAKLRGFIARPVVGGVFMPAVCDREFVQKWSRRAETAPRTWAPLPLAAVTALAATSEVAPVSWRMTTATPAADWAALGFADSGWTVAPGGFGQTGPNRNLNVAVATLWTKGDLWLRRAFTLERLPTTAPLLRICHSGPVEVYLNDVLAARVAGDLRGFENYPITAAARAALRPGRNVLAVHATSSPDNDRPRRAVDAGLIVLAPLAPAAR